jgi:CheY-like chemotaxis protein
MLVNLLCNALKFAPDGSDFGLQVSRWENWVAFTIWDQGIGIPDDKQHLIFQKFQQLESPLTREFEGTGLGLVLTQHLARLHGGDVSFISKPNQGSKFTLLLPPNPPRHNWELRHKIGSQDSQFSTSTPVVSSEKSRLVLIVETVPQFIQNLSEQLTDLGYRVVVARSGTEAVEKARCLQPRAILLNPLIPLLSGWDVLTLLKTDLKTHQIPVIVTATLGDKQRAKMNHCDGFLRLPVQGLELEKMLAELLPEVPYSVPQQLIILWLSLSGNPQNLVSTGAWENKNYIYHSALFLSRFSHCRILEVDDISQASIMAQIWHPNVMVLERDSSIQNPSYVLREISQQESLARLPIVTLDPLTTQVANQVENLSIFPCLANSPEDQLNSQSFPLSISSALLEVVQIATRLSWKPSILVVDSSVLHEEQFGHLLDSEDPNINPEFNSELILGSDNNSPCNFEKNPARLDRINDTNFKIDQALVQYMEIAGFQGIMGKNWEEIIRKIQCKSLDLILICFRGKSFAKIVEALSTLEKIESKIPIIILAQSDINILNQTLSKKQGNKPSSTVELEEHIWKKMAIYLQCFTSSFPLKVLPFNLSVDSLLEEIKVLLTHPKPYK